MSRNSTPRSPTEGRPSGNKALAMLGVDNGSGGNKGKKASALLGQDLDKTRKRGKSFSHFMGGIKKKLGGSSDDEASRLTHVDASGLAPEVPSRFDVVNSRVSLDSFASLASRLSNLQELDLSFHGKGFTVPDGVKYLVSLRALYLEENGLKELPPSVFALKKLQQLYIRKNKLNSIPAGIHKLKSLQYFDISDNLVKGVSADVRKLKHIEVIDLSTNGLKSITEDLCKLDTLEQLLVANNEITDLPDSITNLTRLAVLDLANNQISVLPDDLISPLREAGLSVLRVEGNPCESDDVMSDDEERHRRRKSLFDKIRRDSESSSSTPRGGTDFATMMMASTLSLKGLAIGATFTNNTDEGRSVIVVEPPPDDTTDGDIIVHDMRTSTSSVASGGGSPRLSPKGDYSDTNSSDSDTPSASEGGAAQARRRYARTRQGSAHSLRSNKLRLSTSFSRQSDDEASGSGAIDPIDSRIEKYKSASARKSSTMLEFPYSGETVVANDHTEALEPTLLIEQTPTLLFDPPMPRPVLKAGIVRPSYLEEYNQLGDFQRFIAERIHTSWAGVLKNDKPVVVSVSKEVEQPTDYCPVPFYRAIVRVVMYDRRICIPASDVRTSGRLVLPPSNMLLSIVSDLVSPLFEGANLKKLPSLDDSVKIINLEDALTLNKYKFGVVYAPSGQTEEEEFLDNDDEGTADYQEFLGVIGEKVKLKGYTGYTGGLDTNSDTTGANGLVASVDGMSIMYHVSTYLPNEEAQVAKKRHIGNDIVVIVFKETKADINVETFVSHFNHVFVIVTKVGKLEESGLPLYRVQFAYKNGAQVAEPKLPSSAVFAGDPQFRDMMLRKFVNSERLAYDAPSFSKAISAGRSLYLNNFLDEVFGKGKRPKPKSSRRKSGRSK